MISFILDSFHYSSMRIWLLTIFHSSVGRLMAKAVWQQVDTGNVRTHMESGLPLQMPYGEGLHGGLPQGLYLGNVHNTSHQHHSMARTLPQSTHVPSGLPDGAFPLGFPTSQVQLGFWLHL